MELNETHFSSETAIIHFLEKPYAIIKISENGILHRIIYS